MCRETGGQRGTCSLPVPQLPPCSRHRPGGALLLINLEIKLSAAEALRKSKWPDFPPVFPGGPYTQHSWQGLEPPKLSSPQHSSRQKWRSGCDPTLAVSATHRDGSQRPACLSHLCHGFHQLLFYKFWWSRSPDSPGDNKSHLHSSRRAPGWGCTSKLLQHMPSLPWLWLI